jgi:hypothetical protein
MRGGVSKLDVPFVVALLGGSFVFLDVGPSILFVVFSFLFFGMLWLIYGQLKHGDIYNIQKQF